MMDEMIKLLRDLADWRGVYDESGMGGRLDAEERFRRETGVFAPGRSIPMAMAGGPHQDDEVRLKRWRDWTEAENAKLNDRIRVALEGLGASKAKCAQCGEVFWPEKPWADLCADCKPGGVNDPRR